MAIHATFDGYLVKVARKLKEHEPVPSDARFSAHANLVRPNGHYDGAPTCALYFLQGVGYVAADIRPGTKD